MRNDQQKAYGLTDGLKHAMKRSPRPLWVVITADILLIVIGLLIFALFHHVIPKEQKAVGIESSRYTQETAAPTAVPVNDTDGSISDGNTENTEVADEADITVSSAVENTATQAPAADPVGYFGTKFADKFTSGEVISADTTYQSANVNITVTTYNESGVEFFVADIYVKDISCFKTGFANDKYGKSISEWPIDIAERMNAIVAISGDYYGARSSGNIVRNGTLYREDDAPPRDTAVLYWDGTMETYGSGSFDARAQMEKGAYQTWTFGPALLDSEGKAFDTFSEDADIQKANPRSAVGYFEPGHYCFVTVEGRLKKSKGLTLTNLAKLMETLGCVRAYNLDGGATAQMVWNDSVISTPSGGGRKCSDVLAIVDSIS